MRTKSKNDYAANNVVGYADLNNISENANAIFSSPVAGENVTAGRPGFIAQGDTFFENIVQDQDSNAGSQIYGSGGSILASGTTFKTKGGKYGSLVVTKVSLYLNKTGTPSGNANLDFYAVDANHKPTGASLGTLSITASGVVDGAYNDFVGSVSLPTPGAEYAMMLSVPSGNSSNYLAWRYKTVLTDPNMLLSNSSGTYSLSASLHRRFKLKYQYTWGVAGKLYESRGDDYNRNKFDCFILETKSSGNAALCEFIGLMPGLSGLAAGARYYAPEYFRSVVSQPTGSGSSTQQIYSGQWEAQTFTTDATTTAITKLSLGLRQHTNGVTPGCTITVSLYATSSNLPTGSPLASVTLDYADTIIQDPSTYNDVEFEFATPVTVTPSTKYAIVFSINGGVSGNSMYWADAGSSVYAGGDRCYSNNSGSTWTQDTGNDHRFTVYGTDYLPTATQNTYDLELGDGVSSTEIFIRKQHEHVIYTQDINESNQLGAGSSCEVSYDIPPRTKRIIVSVQSAKAAGSGGVAGQILLERKGYTTAYLGSEEYSNQSLLTATISGNTLTLNQNRFSSTASIVAKIIYIGR